MKMSSLLKMSGIHLYFWKPFGDVSLVKVQRTKKTGTNPRQAVLLGRGLFSKSTRRLTYVGDSRRVKIEMCCVSTMSDCQPYPTSRPRRTSYWNFTPTQTGKAAAKQCTLHEPKMEQQDKVLLEWFALKWSEGATISGPMLVEKAKSFYNHMGLTDQYAFSDGWLACFKLWHGMQQLDISGEQKSADHNPRNCKQRMIIHEIVHQFQKTEAEI